MIVFRKAILIIHGFTGNIYDNEYLMNFLELDPHYDVYARTLPGHRYDRFSNATMDDWKQFVDNQMKELINNGYHSIYVVGHSMGGVLASYLAGKYKEIKKLVLINAAFIVEKDLDKYSHLWQKFLRTSPLILIEFMKLVKESGKYLSKIHCDTLILRSTRDEIVPLSAGDLIYHKISSKKKWMTDVKGASHGLLAGNKKEISSFYIRCFFKGGRLWKRNYQKEI